MKSVFWKTLLLLSLLGAIGANAQDLRSKSDHITISPSEEIISVGTGDIVDASVLPIESLYIPAPEKEKTINNYTKEAATASTASDPIVLWDHFIQMNVDYSNTIGIGTTSHYYTFTNSTSTKLTARIWDIPVASNLDITLYKYSTDTSNYIRVSYSVLTNASEEQLSYIAEPGEYLFAVERTSAVDTSTYQFSITTQSTYDSQEADDNYWDASVQSIFGQVIGTLDNNYDKDFIVFTTTKDEYVNISIGGGDYTAELRYGSTGVTALTLPSNTLNVDQYIPAGTWYWVISSPSQSVNPATNYTFTQQKDVDELRITFDSDEQTDYSKRVNWGSGTFFPIHLVGTISGTARDADGDPVGGTVIEIKAKSSVSSNNDLTYYAWTNDNGQFSKTISSPLGSGLKQYYGGALIYYYDVHTVELNVLDAAGTGSSIPNVVEIDDVSTSTNHNSNIKLNDVAYYIHK